MLYLQKCSDEQIKELMKCYAPDYTDIEIIRRDKVIDIELINNDLPEKYVISDYNVDVYDWNDQMTDCLRDYRKKMLEYFGNQYAIDYLLEGV